MTRALPQNLSMKTPIHMSPSLRGTPPPFQRKTFLAVCWVIVEAPRVRLP